jgi:hypothetical protein
MRNNQYPENLWQGLGRQHHRLYTILDDVEALVEQGSFLTAAKRFGDFRLDEERHIRMEEELFASLQASEPAAPPSTELMRQHEAIQSSMGWICEGLSHCASDWTMAKMAELRSLLRRHEELEKSLCLPDFQAKFSEGEAAEQLLHQLAQY